MVNGEAVKKYLFLITNNYPYGQGEEFIHNEIEYLSREFKKIYIITTNKKDIKTKDIPNNFEVFRIKKNKFKLFEILRFNYIVDFFDDKISLENMKRKINFIYTGHVIKKTILGILKKEKLDLKDIVLYSYWFHWNAYGISKIKGVKKVVRAHGYDLYKEREPQFLKETILENIDYVLPCSFQGEEYLKKEYLKFKNKIETSYLGIENLDELRVKKDNFKIVSCSYIRPVKRVDLIIKALEKLNSYENKIIWVHIGDGEELDYLKKLAQEKLKNIEFKFLGHLKNSEILDYYKKNDIKCFINLSSSEGLPVSMMEVQSYGIPIIATNVGGVSEIVNSNTGILLKENPTPEEIAKAIENIIKLPSEQYKKIQQNSYNNWNKKFNANKNYKIFIEKYLKGFANEK